MFLVEFNPGIIVFLSVTWIGSVDVEYGGFCERNQVN
jgi:hypothetical protein